MFNKQFFFVFYSLSIAIRQQLLVTTYLITGFKLDLCDEAVYDDRHMKEYSIHVRLNYKDKGIVSSVDIRAVGGVDPGL